MNKEDTATFAPQLYIKSGITDISFYEKAFGAVELRRFTNADGGIHVAELSIGNSLFHLHEANTASGQEDPGSINTTTVSIGLFVKDVDEVITRALNAGAIELSPAQSYDYGYRQGKIRDPFGHIWLIETKINTHI